MKSKMKKKLKGMTLIEVIVALAIFVVMTLMMVQVGSVTKSLMMQTNHLNKKTAEESPIASVQDVAAMNELALAHTDDASNPMVVVETPVTFKVTVAGSTKSSIVESKKYTYQAPAGVNEDPYFKTNMRGHLEFYVFDDSAEQPANPGPQGPGQQGPGQHGPGQH